MISCAERNIFSWPAYVRVNLLTLFGSWAILDLSKVGKFQWLKRVAHFRISEISSMQPREKRNFPRSVYSLLHVRIVLKLALVQISVCLSAWPLQTTLSQCTEMLRRIYGNRRPDRIRTCNVSVKD